MKKNLYPHVWEVDQASYRDWISTEEARFAQSLPTSSRLKFSIVMPVHNPPLPALREALVSVLSQTHQDWELCIADDASTDDDVVLELENLARNESRVKLTRLENNSGIASASNAALALTSGDYVVLLDHDDILPEHALATVEHYLDGKPGARLIYSDSDHLNERGERCKPFFKPDWDYLRLLSQNYLNHLTAVEITLLKEVGGWRDGYQGSQDYDLYLRLVEALQPGQILHIPHILYHWRIVPSSVGRSGIGEAVKMARKAIGEHLHRRGFQANVKPAGKAVIFNHVAWQLPTRHIKLLDVVHGETGAEDHTIASTVSSRPLEIHTLHLGHRIDPIHRLEKIQREIANGGYDLFCLRRADLVADDQHWLESVAAAAATDQFGLVGIKCISSDGRLYGGPLFDQARDAQARPGSSPDHSAVASVESRGYIANLLLDQSVDEVATDFFMVSVRTLTTIGGLRDEYRSIGHMTHSLCHAANAKGLRNIWLPGTVAVRTRRAAGDYDPPARAAGNAMTSTRAPFLYPNPNFEQLDWVTHWSE